MIKKFLKSIVNLIPLNSYRLFILSLAGYKIGKNVYIGKNITIIDELKDKSNLYIGDRVSIAPNTTFILSSHPNNSLLRKTSYLKKGKIIIKNDAWIGTGSIIYPDIVIGKESIVAAGAVVTKNVKDKMIVGGVPAKLISKVKNEK